MAAQKSVKKVVLAYSGGLDTSIILKWLQTTYGCEVVTFTADLGQGEELAPARDKALRSASSRREHLHRGPARDLRARLRLPDVPRQRSCMRASICSAPRSPVPLIAKRQIEIAEQMGADAVSHGATGKGNDQVRFELSYYALKPGRQVIAPWREWDLQEPQSSSTSPRRTRSRSPRTSAARRPSRSTPTCCTPPPRAWCWKTPTSRCRTTSIRAPISPGERARQGDLHHDRLQGRDDGRHRRPGPVAGDDSSPSSMNSARSTASAASTWSRTASSA
jgi:hypothetical protein